ncbi:MAG: hypothetical protein IPQ05_12500 [Leptospiraceae bacterium]|nr:hypothetical protein [Leptospiraceae bacterium]
MKSILLLLITLFTLCISCKEKSEPTASKEKEFVIPTKSFLSTEWVSYHLLLLKERNREYETIQELKIKAKSRMQKGIVLYRMKKILMQFESMKRLLIFIRYLNFIIIMEIALLI